MYLKTILLCAFIVFNSLVESAREERPKVRFRISQIIFLTLIPGCKNIDDLNHSTTFNKLMWALNHVEWTISSLLILY